MTLVVETGANVPNAETYADQTYADTYFSKRANAAWAALDVAGKEAGLLKASDYLGAVYRDLWAGERTNKRAGVYTVQPMDWPRTGVTIDVNTVIADNFIPDELKRAQCELALKATVQDLLPDQARLAIREKVGPLEVEYAPYGTSLISYSAVGNLLSPYLEGGGAGAFSVNLTRC